MSRQVTRKTTFQIRVDIGWWKLLSELRTEYRVSFKELTEQALGELYGGVNAKDLRKLLGNGEDAK